MTEKTAVEKLEDQKKRLASLQERRTRAMVRLEAEQAALAKAKEEAVATYGTSNLAELRALYQAQINDNEMKVLEFTLSLDEVEQQLADLERQLGV